MERLGNKERTVSLCLRHGIPTGWQLFRTEQAQDAPGPSLNRFSLGIRRQLGEHLDLIQSRVEHAPIQAGIGTSLWDHP
jgi:hypothetical protein